MSGFKSVKIIHKISDRIDFLFLAEFFRFCGFYVGEETIYKLSPDEEINKEHFDAYIWIPPMEDEFQISDFGKLHDVYNIVYFYEIRKTVLPAGEAESEIRDIDSSKKKRLIEECLCKAGISRLNTDIWNALADVYIKNDIMLASSSLQYYALKDSSAIQDANESFLNAYDRIKTIIKSNLGTNGNIRYAKIWCAVKVNSTRQYQNKALLFSPDKLAKKCKKLYKDYPDFSNAKVLEGLCLDYSTDRGFEAIYAFRQALKAEQDMCYSTAIYYWIGKRYEAYDANQREAEYYYQKAYDTMPKFRNIYKLAVFAKKRRDFAATQAYFAQIIDVLVKAVEINMIDPLELEYAFKAYQQMCHMYYDKCTDISIKYEKIVYYAQAAIDVRNLIESSIFFDRLYGKEKAEAYRDISRSRMSLNSIYLMLSNSYNDLNEFGLAEKYKNLIVQDG